jgi:hypothetical protein
MVIKLLYEKVSYELTYGVMNGDGVKVERSAHDQPFVTDDWMSGEYLSVYRKW